MKPLFKKSFLLYLGIYLISFSTLLFEISLTRVFSISQWYHFAFMVVSMALLGYGASGSFLMVFLPVLKNDTFVILSNSALLFSIFSILSYLITNHIIFDPVKIAWDSMQIVYILVYYIFLSIPFFFSGITISTAISRFSERVHRIYFYDLLGAGSGCLSALLIFLLFGASNAIAIASLSGMLASAIFYAAKKDYAFPYRLFFIIIPVLIVIFSPPFMETVISPYKGLSTALRYPSAETIKTQWDSFSRIDVVKSGAIRFAPGLSLKFQGELPEQIGFTIDGGNLNAISRFSGKKEEIAFTDYLPSAIPYYLTKPDKVLILDPRGGLEILSAIYHEARHIESAEFYPLIIEIIKGDYKNFSGGIYNRRDVNVKAGDARVFIGQSKDRYDIIQISPGDILAASSTGIYGLTEDYRFTAEAFKAYINHLDEDGILSITLYLLPPPRYELRMVSTAIKAMEEIGITSPDRHLAVIRTWGTITVIIKKGGLNNDDIIRIKDFCKNRSFDTEYYFDIKKEETNIYNRFQDTLYFNLLSKIINIHERDRFFEDYIFDITPATDDRPFFHHFFKWNTIGETYNTFGRKWQPFLEGGYLVPAVFVQALIVSIIFIIFPLFFFKPIISSSEKGGKRGFPFLLYFLLIGMGFMFVEISMIQKFILFLGHPVYSISTVLFAILISSGIGSYISGKFFGNDNRSINTIVLILCGMIIIYALSLSLIFNAISSEGLIVRQIISFVFLFPLGLLMGMPFPIGIKLLGKDNPGIIPWAWCVNGCSSVLSSVLVILMALSAGFKITLIISAMMYLGGLLVIKSNSTLR